MYHLWATQIGGVGNLHLDTRICAKLDSRFDFVVGDVSYHAKRPCIEKPELVVEVKAFVLGFTGPQYKVHYYHVIEDDLPKLQALKEPVDSRYLLLFDEDDYLKGFDTATHSSRLDRVIHLRDELDPKIRIAHLKNIEGSLEAIFI